MKPKLLFTAHFIVVTLLFFNTGSYRNWPYKIESDGKYYYQYLVSVWYDGDIDFANNYRHPKQPFMRTEIDHYHFRDEVIPETGRATNIFTTGSAILWSPFFLAAYGSAYLLNNIGLTDIGLDGWQPYFQYMVMYAAVIYSTLTMLMMFDLLKPHFGRLIALVTPLVLFWTTNWLYYSLFEVSMSHVYDLFTLVLFVWLYLKASRSRKTAWYLLLGVVAGLHVLVRTQNILTIAIFVGYYVIWNIGQSRRKAQHLPGMIRNHLIFTALLLVSLTPLFYTNAYIYGSILTVPQGTGFLNLLRPEFYGVLLSGRNGLFSHHPVLVLGLVGLVGAIVNYKTEKACLMQMVLPLLLAFGVQLYINAAAADWWAGHAFGQRRLISGFLLFAVGLAYFQKYGYEYLPKPRIVLPALLALFTLMNAYLIGIHLFMWSYDEPHNIVDWMFRRAPVMLYVYFNS